MSQQIVIYSETDHTEILKIKPDIYQVIILQVKVIVNEDDNYFMVCVC